MHSVPLTDAFIFNKGFYCLVVVVFSDSFEHSELWSPEQFFFFFFLPNRKNIKKEKKEHKVHKKVTQCNG